MIATKRNHAPPHRRGFTLIELMIVIVVIAILAGLLAPAASRSIRSARVAAVVSEISQLEAAIANFKSAHGIEPPSSIALYETTAGWQGDPISSSFIRQIWPQFDFGAHDINGNNISDGPFTLTLGECLVFFLGGVNGNTNPGSTTAQNNLPGLIGAPSGFSKNPTSPFDRGGSRDAPLFEFQVSRFTDLDGDGFPEYKDTLPSQKNPYLYYSGYDGQGYALTTGGSWFTIEYISPTTSLPPPAPVLPYYQDTTQPSTTFPFWSQFWKPNSHQLISPGFDAKYGYGGPYIPKATTPLPPNSSSGTSPTNLDRQPEADNITNFSSGELVPQ